MHLLVDVDGVLNPLALDPRLAGYRPFITHPNTRWWDGSSLRVRLNPRHGEWLTTLAADTGANLAWGSTWEGEANTWIGPPIGLPEMPWVPIPSRDHDMPLGTWKARQIAAWTSEPFVWFEDDPNAADEARRYIRAAHLVVFVDPRTGLTRDHIRTAETWLRANGGAR